MRSNTLQMALQTVAVAGLLSGIAYGSLLIIDAPADVALFIAVAIGGIGYTGAWIVEINRSRQLKKNAASLSRCRAGLPEAAVGNGLMSSLRCCGICKQLGKPYQNSNRQYYEDCPLHGYVCRICVCRGGKDSVYEYFECPRCGYRIGREETYW